MLDRKNSICGENIGNPSKKSVEAGSVTSITMTNDELTNAFLWADLGRCLMRFEPSPSSAKPPNNAMIEMREVAIPTCSAL